MARFFFFSLAAAAVSARQFSVPVLPLSNAAVPGLTMPYTGLGTGGYRSGLSPQPPAVYPESWNGDQNETVAKAVTAAVAGYIQLAAAGGVPSIRIDNADSYNNLASVGLGIKTSGVPRERVWLLTKVGNGQAMGFQDVLDQWQSVMETMCVRPPAAAAPPASCRLSAFYLPLLHFAFSPSPLLPGASRTWMPC